jgi:cell wall-associated NlpC family hydrolase
LADAVRAAVGRPYGAGASGPESFDCSGLVRWAARRAGLDLPRSSFAQYDVGTPVPRAALAPGDLVFFDTNGPGPSDVGVVIGDDLAVSATTHGVRQHVIFGAYWGGHYVGARRFS